MLNATRSVPLCWFWVEIAEMFEVIPLTPLATLIYRDTLIKSILDEVSNARSYKDTKDSFLTLSDDNRLW